MLCLWPPTPVLVRAAAHRPPACTQAPVVAADQLVAKKKLAVLSSAAAAEPFLHTVGRYLRLCVSYRTTVLPTPPLPRRRSPRTYLLHCRLLAGVACSSCCNAMRCTLDSFPVSVCNALRPAGSPLFWCLAPAYATRKLCESPLWVVVGMRAASPLVARWWCLYTHTAAPSAAVWHISRTIVRSILAGMALLRDLLFWSCV